MKTVKFYLILMMLVTAAGYAEPMGTAFTYQGRLLENGQPGTDTYDLQCKLFDSKTDGTQIGDTLVFEDGSSPDGYFTVEIDFSVEVFNGEARYLEMALRPWDSTDPNDFVVLADRVELTPTPYALYAKTAGSAPADNDWMVSGSDMYSIPSGNVGIGTTNPDEELVVGEPLGLGWSIPAITVGNTSGGAFTCGDSTNHLMIDHGSIFERARIRSSSDTGGWGKGDIEFICGKIGIGTSTPSAKLHCTGNGAYSYYGVAPSDNAYNLILEAQASGTGMFGGIKFNNTGNSQDRVAYIGAVNNDWTNSKLSLVFGTDDGTTQSERMRLTESGKLGIGIMDPAAKLHCVGNTAYVYSGLSGTAPDNDEAYNIIIETPTNGTWGFGGIKFNNTGNSQDRVGYIGSINEHYSNQDLSLVFGTDGGGQRTEKMRITGSGNVGIGTTTPARKLHVSDVMRLEPRSSAPSSPSEGDIYYDSTLHSLMVYNGTIWKACF